MSTRRESFEYILKKIVVYAITLFVAFSLAFFFLRLIPGNPVQRFVANLLRRYSRSIPQTMEIIASFQSKFGLDKDILTQYVMYLRGVFLEFDLGPSFLSFPKPAIEVIMLRLPWSIGLLGFATLISWSLGLLIGVLVGWRRDSKLDKGLFTLALGFSQVPYYLVALLLVFLFSYMLGVLPSKWAFSPTTSIGLNLEFIMDVISHAILPALSFVLVDFFGWLISTRALTITILGEDYLLFARAKGLRKIRLINRYVLRNVLLPQVTGLAMSLGFVVNGLYLVEWVFVYPGIGTLLVKAMSSLDYNVFQGIILLSIFTVLVANMMADVLYPFLDPRVRREAE